MQRHFSNRGEALSEVTAARMLARHNPARSASTVQAGRARKTERWFNKTETVPVSKAKHTKREKGDIPLLYGCPTRFDV